VIGYVATAGIAIAIVTFSFLITHDPTQDPFEKQGGVDNGFLTSVSRPNPVDVTLLRYFRRRPGRSRLKDACLKVRLLVFQRTLRVVDVFLTVCSSYERSPDPDWDIYPH
jgi:hypothetical protein